MMYMIIPRLMISFINSFLTFCVYISMKQLLVVNALEKLIVELHGNFTTPTCIAKSSMDTIAKILQFIDMTTEEYVRGWLQTTVESS